MSHEHQTPVDGPVPSRWGENTPGFPQATVSIMFPSASCESPGGRNWGLAVPSHSGGHCGSCEVNEWRPDWEGCESSQRSPRGQKRHMRSRNKSSMLWAGRAGQPLRRASGATGHVSGGTKCFVCAQETETVGEGRTDSLCSGTGHLPSLWTSWRGWSWGGIVCVCVLSVRRKGGDAETTAGWGAARSPTSRAPRINNGH